MASTTRRILVSKDVTFVRGNDRIARLAKRADLAPAVAATRQTMADADRDYATGLAALRQAVELTQVALAKKLGVTQAAVSRMEQPHDMLLSTLNAYLEAVGGHATVIVHFDGGTEIALDLTEFRSVS
jgi:DNA-binding XRE family transcriptional regulator